ncbi:MAG: FAD-binding protein [Acidimicrobiia bacterium]|nr:FAD-binding protein [Acidimicrobiia bacterium]
MRPGTTLREGRVWRNWGGNQASVPIRWHRPTTEEELVAVVRRAAAEGTTVKAVGAGHSYSAIACTSGHLVDLSGYDRVLAADLDSGVVTVQAGIPLWKLADELAVRGRALEVLGDINVQSLAGAISTGTHGPGIGYANLASRVIGCRLIDGQGQVHDIAAADDDAAGEAPLLAAVRVGLGALGLLSTITLQTVPAFNLRVIERALRVDRLLADLDAVVYGSDHPGLFWFPGSDVVLVRQRTRTDEWPRPRSKRAAWWADVAVDNYVFDAACSLSSRFPSVARSIISGASAKRPHEWVDRSDRVFTTPRLARVLEMEYAVAPEVFPEVFERLGRLVDSVGTPLPVPVEIRWTKGDDALLSHAHRRDSVYIAAHVHHRQPYDQYFAGFESIMDDYDGRPHWGKLHFQTAETLTPRYPRWVEFAAVRRRLDPHGRFTNPYLDRVLGPITTDAEGAS